MAPTNELLQEDAHGMLQIHLNVTSASIGFEHFTSTEAWKSRTL